MQIQTMSAGPDFGAQQLAPIELACLADLAQGRSIRETCSRLSIDEEQWQNALDGAEMKLGARNRLHTVILALRLGLIEDTVK